MTPAVRTHRHVPARDAAAVPLLLLHGTDGAETDLLGFAQELDPGAAKLSPRGGVVTEGGRAFVRRLPGAGIDLAHLEGAIDDLDRFIASARREGLLARAPLAVGYSSGAIMAAAMLLLRPETLAGAVLLRPLDPFTGAGPAAALGGVPVLVVAGADDQRRTRDDAPRIARRLEGAGAAVTSIELPAGHAIEPADLDLARAWLGLSARSS